VITLRAHVRDAIARTSDGAAPHPNEAKNWARSQRKRLGFDRCELETLGGEDRSVNCALADEEFGDEAWPGGVELFEDGDVWVDVPATAATCEDDSE
jgi:hypothetical protein